MYCGKFCLWGRLHNRLQSGLPRNAQVVLLSEGGGEGGERGGGGGGGGSCPSSYVGMEIHAILYNR